MTKNTDKAKASAPSFAKATEGKPETRTFNEALQHAKETIGFFANGDLSHVANEAKRLWYAIDNVQQGKPLQAHADKLAEALKAAQAWLIACSDKEYTYARQAIAIKASEALAAYEEASK